MIPVTPPPEPAAFDEECRKRGNQWLAQNADVHPHRQPLWRAFLADLREGFGGRCGFSAMYVPRGTVDHWISVDSDRWLRRYELGELGLPGLFKVAPLLACSVARRDGLALAGAGAAK